MIRRHIASNGKSTRLHTHLRYRIPKLIAELENALGRSN
jgi:hypothetical protein